MQIPLDIFITFICQIVHSQCKQTKESQRQLRQITDCCHLEQIMYNEAFNYIKKYYSAVRILVIVQ